MASDAITTYNPVSTTTFVVNKYDDIDGGRAAQDTPRGRLCFRDTDGRFVLPRSLGEAQRAVYPVDWAKPLNPPPYFDGPGLNGAPPNAFSDGSFDSQDSTFAIDPNVAFLSNWPVGYRIFEVPPLFYNIPVTSGNKILVYDGESTLTYGSGNYTDDISQFNYGSKVYADYSTGNNGKLTVSGSVAGNVAVGVVVGREIFGPRTITVKMRGTFALT